MTEYKKIAISLPVRACEHVRRSVKRGEAASVSAYIAAAIEAKAQRDSLEALLAEMLAETGGPITPAEQRRADQRLGIARKRKPKATRP